MLASQQQIFFKKNMEKGLEIWKKGIYMYNMALNEVLQHPFCQAEDKNRTQLTLIHQTLPPVTL